MMRLMDKTALMAYKMNMFSSFESCCFVSPVKTIQKNN